ncbi:DNA polymerase Y family protein [Streptomyces sp. cg28]|uniref:DNA polymerase Y family protein n=1 Tax=Streptomyces sp. cg28 TaxID=3403457 RepID=UPI003B21E991
MGDGQVTSAATVMHVRVPAGTPEPVYRDVLEVLSGISATVQSIPPGAALVQLRGALRFFGCDARALGEMTRLRTVARLGCDVRVGIASSWSAAATLSGHLAEPGGVLAVDDDHLHAFLAPLPVIALHGIGSAQARTLEKYGVTTIGALASLDRSTVQRILGGRAGRTAHERARGIDHRPVTPRLHPESVRIHHTFAHQELDSARVRARLLDLVVQLGAVLRERNQVARAVGLHLTFAGGPTWERTRRLVEASAHEDDLRSAAYRLMDAAGLQRARLTAMSVRGQDLVPAATAPLQITLDPIREARLCAEQVIDRANRRFGPGTVGPATVLGKASY